MINLVGSVPKGDILILEVGSLPIDPIIAYIDNNPTLIATFSLSPNIIPPAIFYNSFTIGHVLEPLSILKHALDWSEFVFDNYLCYVDLINEFDTWPILGMLLIVLTITPIF